MWFYMNYGDWVENNFLFVMAGLFHDWRGIQCDKKKEWQSCHVSYKIFIIFLHVFGNFYELNLELLAILTSWKIQIKNPKTN
jgi:hypothetical protein